MNHLTLKTIVLCFSLISVIGCQSEDSPLISESIIEEIDNNCTIDVYCDIDLQDVTNFEWDKVVLYQTGSSGSEISKWMGVEYQESSDLMMGMIFTLDNEIVYEERILYHPEDPTEFQIFVDSENGASVGFDYNNAIVQGRKVKFDENIFYSIKVLNEQ